MGYTNDELRQMTYDELCHVKYTDMSEYPPVTGLGFPYIVQYACKCCGQSLEGSERMASKNAKDVKCPYCGEILWNSAGKNRLRKSAFPIGHFSVERRKRYLKNLRDRAKYREKIKIVKK